MEEKNDIQKEAVRLVVEQLIGMFENNILQDCGAESFVGWCEDGGVFWYNDGLSKEVLDEATKLMNEVAPAVDELTFKWLNLGH